VQFELPPDRDRAVPADEQRVERHPLHRLEEAVGHVWLRLHHQPGLLFEQDSRGRVIAAEDDEVEALFTSRRGVAAFLLPETAELLLLGAVL